MRSKKYGDMKQSVRYLFPTYHNRNRGMERYRIDGACTKYSGPKTEWKQHFDQRRNHACIQALGTLVRSVFALLFYGTLMQPLWLRVFVTWVNTDFMWRNITVINQTRWRGKLSSWLISCINKRKVFHTWLIIDSWNLGHTTGSSNCRKI